MDFKGDFRSRVWGFHILEEQLTKTHQNFMQMRLMTDLFLFFVFPSQSTINRKTKPQNFSDSAQILCSSSLDFSLKKSNFNFNY